MEPNGTKYYFDFRRTEDFGGPTNFRELEGSRKRRWLPMIG